jgi:PAS domain S-box-containing protein
VPQKPSKLARYGLALGATALMVPAQALLVPFLGPSMPFATLYVAVAASVWFGGMGPGIASALAGYIVVDWLFLEPRHAIAHGWSDVVTFLAFAASSGSIIVFGHLTRRARAEAQARATEATESAANLLQEARERGRAEAAFREAEARLEQAFQVGEVGSFDWDLNTNRVLWSDSMKRMYGVSESTAGDLLAWSREHVHAEDRERIDREAAGHVAKGGDLVTEFRIVRGARHDVRWIESRTRVDLDSSGKAVRMTGVVVDITDRKRAEELLHEREARFRALAELAPCCVWSAAPDGSLTYANRKWYEFSGLSTENTVGFQWADALHPEDREYCIDTWRHAVAHGTNYRVEVRNRRYDGEYRWLLTEAMPVRGSDGTIIAWFGTSVDIHDQKVAQESLREADRKKNEFLAMLGHEIRNPLSVIANANRILTQRASPRPAKVRAHQMLERQIAQLTRIVDDLLDVSRVAEGKIRLRRERIEVASFVNAAVEVALPHLEERGQTLHVSLPAEPLCVEADSTRMVQVLGNLLHNAAKFSERPGSVWLSLVEREEEAVLSVRDSGVGISAEMLPRIFEIFVQGDQTLRRSRGGLGIGLALARRLVELQGGTISVRSEGVGKGTEFTVRMPLVPAPGRGVARSDEGEMTATSEIPAASDVSVHEHSGRAPSAAKARVLVVDDNADSVESLALILSHAGHEVKTAVSGSEARRIAEEFCPEVVLLDIGMPETDGYEIARWIRSRPELRDPYLVAVTGYGQEEDRRRSSEAGFDEHLVKPVEPVALQKLIAAAPRTRVAAASGS